MDNTIEIAGRRVARIGLGTNRLTETSENAEFLRRAASAGIGMIDTAHLYTDGRSEEAIGTALDGSPDGCVIATKGGFRPGEGRPDVLRGQIDESLRRLRTEAIDLYYLHRLDPETPLEETLAVIAEYRDSGRIREAGISAVGIEEIERAREVVPIAAVQNEYSLAHREHEEVVDHCAREGLVFVPYFPLRGSDAPAVREIASRHDATTTQIVLAWMLRRSPAMFPIPGTLSIEHLRQNLDAQEIELSDAEYEALTD